MPAGMKRREFMGLVYGVAAWPVVASAQQPKKIPRIGILYHAASAEEEGINFTSLREGFKSLGYVEGGNIYFEDRFPAESMEKMEMLARQLVDLTVDVFIAVSTQSGLAAMKATKTIPIVFAFAADPVGSGLVSSLSHPGGNVTGLTHIGVDLASKRLQLIKDTVPGLSSIALIWDPTMAMSVTLPEREATRAASGQVGLACELIECRSPDAIEEACSSASRFGAAILGNSAWYFNERTRFAEVAVAKRLAVMGQSDVFPEAGLMMSYGANWPAIMRAIAPIVIAYLAVRSRKTSPYSSQRNSTSLSISKPRKRSVWRFRQ